MGPQKRTVGEHFRFFEWPVLMPPLVYRTLSSSHLYVVYSVPGSMYELIQTEVPPPPTAVNGS